MIRQLDFLTGFALRAVRDTRRSDRAIGQPPTETDRLDAMLRRGRQVDDIRGEPPLDEVLADPIIKQMMSSDDVDDGELRQAMGVKPDQDG